MNVERRQDIDFNIQPVTMVLKQLEGASSALGVHYQAPIYKNQPYLLVGELSEWTLRAVIK